MVIPPPSDKDSCHRDLYGDTRIDNWISHGALAPSQTRPSILTGFGPTSMLSNPVTDDFQSSVLSAPPRPPLASADHQRARRIRAALFDDDSGSQERPLKKKKTESCVDRLAEPSNNLKSAVVNLVQYQDSADLALRALPELIRLLGDEDDFVVQQACQMVSRLARREASRAAVTSNPSLIDAIESAVENRESNEDIVRYVSSVLYYASLHPSGLNTLFECCPNTIRVLTKMLDLGPVDHIVFFVVTTVHNMLLHEQELRNRKKQYPDIRALLRECQAASKLTGLLKNQSNGKFLAILTDCLQVLSIGDSSAKRDILVGGGVHELLRILTTLIYEKALWTSSRLLKGISVCSETKKAIIASNGIHTLLKIITGAINQDEGSRASVRVIHNCLYVIRNCSNFATNIENQTIDELVRVVIENLNSTDAIFVQCGVGILCNLTCNNQHNKTLCVQSNGVEALVRALIQSSDEAIIEPAVCALRHITSRHLFAQHAQESIRLAYGIPTIVRFISTNHSTALVKATAGLIRNLAVSPTNILPLRENGVLPRLVSLVKNLLKKPTPPKNSHAVVVEACLGALLSLLQSSCSNRISFRDSDHFDLLTELAVSDSHGVKVQRCALIILNDLVCEPRDDDQDADTSALVAAKLSATTGFPGKLAKIVDSDTGLSAIASPILAAMNGQEVADSANWLDTDL